jgi:peroxiredoxin
MFNGKLDLPAINGDDSWELPLAATYVIGTDGIISYAFVEADYTTRAEPAAVLEAVRRAKRGG